MLATPRYTPLDGEERCKFVEQQLPLITEDGDFLDVVVAHCWLGYCYASQQVFLDLEGYSHTDENGRMVWYANTGTPAIPERPYAMRFVEKLLSKKIYGPVQRDRMLADDPDFQTVRDRLPVT